MSFESGKQYRLRRDHGNAPLHLRAGSVGTVREVVPADVSGAHNDDEDAVVLVFDGHAIDYDEDGSPAIVTADRAVAFALADFEGDDPLFEEAK